MLLHIPDCSCSPHSREVVKTRFFTLFWSREPQKGAVQGRLGRFRQSVGPKKKRAHRLRKTCVNGSLWALWGVPMHDIGGAAGPDQETSL